MQYKFPTKGDYIKVTSPYGKRVLNGVTENHVGIDMTGFSEITPTCYQVVTLVAYHAERGNYVRAKDALGYVHIYQHLQNNSVGVVVGDTIRWGDTIGLMGRTGKSTGVHLHYEVVGTDGKTINPATILGIANAVGSYKQDIEEVVNMATNRKVRTFSEVGEDITGQVATYAQEILNGDCIVRCNGERLFAHWSVGANEANVTTVHSRAVYMESGQFMAVTGG